MDFGTVVISIVVIIAVAALAKWYFNQTDEPDIDADDIDYNEMNLGLDDRLREMIHPKPEVDEDPYGENSNYPSYRATLVNRGIKDQK